jgi:hypothetical protein
MTTSKQNYSPQDTALISQRYKELGNDGLEEIAKEVGKPVASVRSKLVKMGEYVPSDKSSYVRRTEGPSKKELLRELEGIFKFDITGLEPANKQVLKDILEHVKQHA